MPDLVSELNGEDDLGDLADLFSFIHYKQARATARFMTNEKGMYYHVWNHYVWNQYA